MVDVSPEELAALLERGWRRFGPVYFRPACEGCQECVPLRIDVAGFKPTKSQRRAAKASARLLRVVDVPKVDDARLALYRRWHAAREEARGWEPSQIDAERYAFDFTFAHPCVREVSFVDPEDGALVGVGICDEVPNALSAIYFFWDPERAPGSLGVAHVVALIEDARARGLPYVYLGYRVQDCPSLVYKARYRPHQLLEGRPAFAESPVWVDETALGDDV